MLRGVRSFHVGLIETRLFFLKRQLVLQFFDLSHSSIADLIKLCCELSFHLRSLCNNQIIQFGKGFRRRLAKGRRISSPFIFDFVREETSSFFASNFVCKVSIAHFAFSYRSNATKHTPTTLSHGIQRFRQDEVVVSELALEALLGTSNAAGALEDESVGSEDGASLEGKLDGAALALGSMQPKNS